MEYQYFIQESPKSEKELTEEEIYKCIFPPKLETIENLNEMNLETLYFINNSSSKNENIKKESAQNEVMNTLLLIDDYEAVFNQLEENPNENMNEKEWDKNSFLENSNMTYDINYEKEDFSLPFFVKNIVSENKFFYPINNENLELVINVNESNKKEKIQEEDNFQKPKIIQKDEKKDTQNIIEIKNQENRRTKGLKRGPYKKKEKPVEQVNTEDICFPFTSQKGKLNTIFPVMQLSNFCSLDYSDFNQNENYDISSIQDESCDKNKNEEFKEEKKNESIFFTNQIINLEDDVCFLKFETKKYFINSNGKKKRIKKKRKYKPDDIRKKIKARFHKTIKNIINENLKKAGSKELFDFFPQSFIGNVTRKVNFQSLDLTYKEMLSTDFVKQINSTTYLNENIDNMKLLRNIKVLNYLEKNPEICKRAGFDLIKNMKYKNLLKNYFVSEQFENSINKLKEENESAEYIQEYIYRAKTYIRFYSNYEKEEKKNKINESEEIILDEEN